MTPNPISVAACKRLAKLQSVRGNFESQWRDIRELVRINTTTPGQENSPGTALANRIYDGTAPWALEQLSAGLNSFLTSPTDRWFNIGITSNTRRWQDWQQGLNEEDLAWLEEISDGLFEEYSDPEVNLNPCINENYMDIGGMGTSVLYQDYDWDAGHLFFRSFPLSDCYIAEGAKGRIDTLYRRTSMDVRQIKQEFSRSGDRIPSKIAAEQDESKTYWVIHEVRPRSDDEKKAAKSYGGRMAFTSCWVAEELKDDPPMREHGFEEFPYHVPRWTKLNNEVYGRSPAMNCLPDIRMLNAMAKVVIKAAQKIVDPPLIVPDDGFIMPIKTHPGSLLMKTAGQEDTIVPLETRGRIDIGLDLLQSKQEQIMKSFYVDWIIRNKKRERQTATEVMDDRNEMLRQMSPMLGRLQVELLNPMIVRSYNLMNKAGRFRPAPAGLQGKELRVYYVSPAAKAQFGSKGQNLNAFINDLTQYAAVDPTIVDIVNPDELASQLALYRDVSRKVLRTPEQIDVVRKEKQQQQQIQAGAEAAKNLGSAAANFSKARATEVGVP